MKTAFMVVVAALSLAACSEPVPQSQWKQDETKMTQVPGFEDCIIAKLQLKTPGDPIYLVRCPNSTVDAGYVVPRGKSRATLSTHTSEVDVDEARTKKIAELEASINQLAAKLKDLK